MAGEQSEIERIAEQLIAQYGEEAEIIAFGQADTMLNLGDRKGFESWKKVMAAISWRRSPFQRRRFSVVQDHPCS